jgi:aliphatic nitrilase
VIADLDFSIDKRKRLMDRAPLRSPGLLSLLIDRTPVAYVHERRAQSVPLAVEDVNDHCGVPA